MKCEYEGCQKDFLPVDKRHRFCTKKCVKRAAWEREKVLIHSVRKEIFIVNGKLNVENCKHV